MSGKEHHDPMAGLDDPRVAEALEEYLLAAEEGKRPNREAFLARHAEIAKALAECLDGLDALHRSAARSQKSALRDSTASASPLVQDPVPQAPLGDFRIVREIGRGGMGVVYEAEQMSLGRRVALKVLPFAAALDTRHLQRFKTEAQAAACLHHPNIVPVYGVGVERGVHYYAMQLIDGQNLAALVEQLRRGKTSRRGRGAARTIVPSTGPYPASSEAAPLPVAQAPTALGMQLSTQRSNRPGDFFRTIARLAAQAADALEHAHDLGIVHRDIKPANLLVDQRGNLWITDFGLAQINADAGLTQTGDLLGTLRYMSPEQASSQRVLIDHRTDVYSLGATLYELLTLRPIFGGTDRRTLLEQILHQEPRPLRAVDPSIPPELETIVLKAIAKSPADRYATARDLADDLQRFLRDEPIRARRPTPVQRARKWLRRHPSVPVLAAVLLALLTAGSVVAALLIRGEQENTKKALADLKLQEEKAQLAAANAKQRARHAIERLQIARRTADEIIQMVEDDLADNPHLQGLRKRVLEALLTSHQEFIEECRDDPDAPQAELELARDRVQEILDNLAVLQGAGQIFLLNDPPVRDALKVDHNQRQRLDRLWRELTSLQNETFKDFGDQTAEEQRQSFLKLARTADAGIAEILLPGQVNRLQQIALQLKGLTAFHDPDLVAKLKLTTAQRDRIRVIEAEMTAGFAACRGYGQPWFGSSGKTREEIQKHATEQTVKVLTEEQAKQWKELTGEPFVRPAPGFPQGLHIGLGTSGKGSPRGGSGDKSKQRP
jgi:serine/threonine protein kinase